MQTASQNVHLAMQTLVDGTWSPANRKELVQVTVAGSARLAVNLDTANNGFGGIDHAVMLSAEGSPSVNFLNGRVKIGNLGAVPADVYWRVRAPGIWQLTWTHSHCTTGTVPMQQPGILVRVCCAHCCHVTFGSNSELRQDILIALGCCQLRSRRTLPGSLIDIHEAGHC
jgi:hypothetical protein